MPKLGVSICTLNQLAMDFDGNCERIMKSIEIARQNGASIRVGPELEICGYSCEDSFFEWDTCHHSWETVSTILRMEFNDIIIDLGMPIYKDGALYNCRVVILNGKVLMIRPKTRLADAGNYRESRWFTAWNSESSVHWFALPSFIVTQTGQKYVPFGSGITLEIFPDSMALSTLDSVKIGFEMCEELWVPDAAHVSLFGTRGVDIIVNGSGSYWEIRKLDRALELMKTATSKSGGLYAFSNLIGCDGARICFYGRSLLVLNGKVVAKTTTEDTLLNEVEVATYNLDPLDIVNYRQQYNIRSHTSDPGSRLTIYADHIRPLEPESGLSNSPKNFTIAVHNFKLPLVTLSPFRPCHLQELLPEQEIMMYGSLWLWDYLRTNSLWSKGFIVPLSGGLDSASVVCMVYSMCSFIYNHMKNQPARSSDPLFFEALDSIMSPTSLSSVNGPKDICAKLLRCVYLKTKYSGRASEERAQRLAKLCGAEFHSIDFTEIYNSVDLLTAKTLNRSPPKTFPLRLQNLQARLRMLITYDLSDCNRLVLATGNVDEALVGYLTKYDCSSADINPIGSLSKHDLRRFVAYIRDKVLTEDPEGLTQILDAVPSAELTGEDQSDEQDLGLTYDELSLFGRLRRGEFGACGPYSLFCKLLENSEQFNQPDDPIAISTKVKRFFTLHARNRHKQTVLTPSLHAETFSPDDNRFDQRQFLFRSDWKRQFKAIDERVAKEMECKRTR